MLPAFYHSIIYYLYCLALSQNIIIEIPIDGLEDLWQNFSPKCFMFLLFNSGLLSLIVLVLLQPPKQNLIPFILKIMNSQVHFYCASELLV